MSNAKQIQAARGSSPGAVGADGATGHVVIASEDEVRRAALAQALVRDGHQPAAARAALEFYAQVGIAGPDLRHPRRPAMVILDATGTRWATFDLLEVACGAPWRLPVVALAADADGVARARALGAVAALRLPIDPLLLRAEVMTIVSPATRGAA